MMNILFLGGNMAKPLAEWLEQQGEQVMYRDDKVTLEDVDEYAPEWIISYNYKYLIPKAMIDAVNGRAINLHISLLPYNRGYHPNVWSFLDDTPKGVTIHYIDEGIDTGDILVQKEVDIDEEKETLKSSYNILQQEIQMLFQENWEKIKRGELLPHPQSGGGQLTIAKSSQNSLTASLNKVGIYQSEHFVNDIGLELRKVEEQDKEDVFQWRNHPDVRRNSFSSEPITLDEHRQWFTAKLQEQTTTMYMACSGNEKIGTIRYEHTGKYICVSVMLNPQFIGRGLGAKVIASGTEKYIQEIVPKEPIIAEIKPENVASLKAFKRAGFEESYRTYVYKRGINRGFIS